MYIFSLGDFERKECAGIKQWLFELLASCLSLDSLGEETVFKIVSILFSINSESSSLEDIGD